MLIKFKEIALFATVFLMLSGKANAVPEWRGGTVQTIYVDPSDIVFVLTGGPGPCGSSLYHIQRSNANFKEFYTLVLTAMTTGKSLNLFVSSCVGDRNILSHGNML